MRANYEDDNSNYRTGDTIFSKLQNYRNMMCLKWLEDNHMNANTNNSLSDSE